MEEAQFSCTTSKEIQSNSVCWVLTGTLGMFGIDQINTLLYHSLWSCDLQRVSKMCLCLGVSVGWAGGAVVEEWGRWRKGWRWAAWPLLTVLRPTSHFLKAHFYGYLYAAMYVCSIGTYHSHGKRTAVFDIFHLMPR